MIPLEINGRRQNIDLPGETPLLWTLRDEPGLTGTKFGCGMALCGACTVHLTPCPSTRRWEHSRGRPPGRPWVPVP
jgi:isoquinoline 1-oxidoreductase alpha subunit